MKKTILLLALISSLSLSACEFTFFESTPGNTEQENSSEMDENTEDVIDEREPISVSLQDPEFSFLEGDSEFIKAVNIVMEDAYLASIEGLSEEYMYEINEAFTVETFDEENYYLSVYPAWDGNMTITMFLNEAGANLIAVDKRGCGPLCQQSMVFFTLEGDTLTEHMDIPFLEEEEQIELLNQVAATLEELDAYEMGIAPIYTLPQDGTTITLVDQYDAMRPEEQQLGTLYNFEYDHETGTFTKTAGRDFSNAFVCDSGKSYSQDLADKWMKIAPYPFEDNELGMEQYKFSNLGMQLKMDENSGYNLFADDQAMLIFDEAEKSGCVTYDEVLRPTLSIFEPGELFISETDLADAFKDFGQEHFTNFSAQVFVQEFVEDTNVTFYEFEYLDLKMQAATLSCGVGCPDLAIADNAMLKEILNGLEPYVSPY